MSRLIAVACLLALGACGSSGGQVRLPSFPPTVLLVQVDGLTPGILEGYLRRPSSRGADRGLHALLGTSAPGAERLTHARAAGTTALAPLGADGVVTAGTLLTGATPLAHGAWAEAPTLAADVSPVFERVGPRPSIVAGMPGRGAVQVDAADDAARVDGVLARLPANPAVVAVRLTGLADALRAGRMEAAPGAMAGVDVQIARLVKALPAATVTVLVGGYGASPAVPGQAHAVADLASTLQQPAEKLRAGGGLLRIDDPRTENLLPLVKSGLAGAVLTHDGEIVGILDFDIGGFRPVFAGEFPGWPELEARLLAAVPTGSLAAFASQGTTFGAGSGVTVGGPSAAEGEVPLYIAGPILAGVDPTALDGMALAEVAATIQGALTDGPEGRWPALRRRQAPAPTPTLIAALGGPAEVPDAVARGAAAFQAGHFEEAVGLLATPATGEAEVWRGILHAWAARKALGQEGEPPAWPAATGWPGVILAVARLDARDEAAPPLPPAAGLTPDQQALHTAFAALYPPPSHPCTAPEVRPRDRLAAAAATFAQRGLPGFAALADASRARMLPDPEEIRVAVEALLDHATRPGAGHARVGVLQDLLLTSMLRVDIAEAADAEIGQAAELLLLALQAAMAADTGPGAADRRVARITLLIDGVAARRQPALLEETIAQAVAGQTGVSAAIVKALVASGGLMSLLRGDPVRSLVTLVNLMEEALAPIKDRPVASLGPDERVARAMPHLLTAMVLGLQGKLDLARPELDQAEALLPLDGVLADREAALKGLGPDDEASLAAWGPFVRAAVILAGTALDLLLEDAPAAFAHGRDAVELARRVARAELGRAGLQGLDAHVDALAAVGQAGLDWAAAAITEAPDVAARVEAVRAAVRAVPLDAPAADADARPWLVLLSVLAHDVAWVAGDRAPAGLAPATAAAEGLMTTWRPDSRLGQAALLALLAAQHTLPDLEKIKDVDGFTSAFEKLPRLVEALKQVQTTARALFPEAEIAPQLQADRVERVVLENILTLLGTDPAQWAEVETLLAPIEAKNQALYALVKDRAGDSRDLLALVLAFAEAGRGQYREAAERAAVAGAWAPGPSFAGHGLIWRAMEARFRAAAGDLRGADAAAAQGQSVCGPLGWRVALARGVWLMQLRDPAAARGQFRAAREGGRRAGFGEYGARFSLAVQDGNSLVNATIEVPVLGMLLGRASGTFQLGAGGTSVEKQSRQIGWQFVPAGTAADAAFDSLALEGWMALAAGDEATGGEALSNLMALFFGVDPRFIDELPTAGLPPYPPQAIVPRSPYLLAWLATLAELHGHEALGVWLLQQLAARAGMEWKDPPGGIERVCEGEAPEDAPPIIAKLRCQAPATLHRLLGPKVSEAFAAVVDTRLREKAGEKVDAKKALAALRAVAPGLAGNDGAGRKAADALRAGKPDAAKARAAINAGFACDLALLSTNKAELAPLVAGAMDRCGLAPFRAVIALGQAQTLDPDAALAALQAAIEISARLPPLRDQLFAPAWAQVRERLLRGGALAARTKPWIAVAEAVKAPDQALWLRTVALASQPGPALVEQAKALLRSAWAADVRSGPAVRYLKQVALGADARQAAEELLK